MMVRRLALASATLVLAATAVGCAGSGAGSGTNTRTFPAAEWADGLCAAITTYKASLGAAGIGEDAKDSASEVRSVTKTFISDLNDLGRPDSSAGQRAKDAIDELADSLGFYADTIESDVREADPFSASTPLNYDVKAMDEKVSSTFKEIYRLDATGELGSAFKQAKSCASLAGKH